MSIVSKVTATPRASPTQLGVLAGIGAVLWLAWTVVLVGVSGVFDPSQTTVDPTTKKSVTVSTFELTTAKFSVVSMLSFGALLMLIGIVVAVSEMVRETVSTTPDPAVPVPGGGGNELAPVTATAVAAVATAVAGVVQALADALKGAKASTALLIVGAAIFIFGGLVAWQTIPGTDRSPTITVGDTPAATTSAGTAASSTAATGSAAASSAAADPVSSAPGTR